MTIPTLIKNYQEKQTVTKLKSTYSILQEAIRLMVVENGTVDKWGSNYEERSAVLEELLPRYVNIQKECKGYTSGCIGEQYRNRFNSDLGTVISPLYNTYLLKNGAGIKIFKNGSSRCIQDMTMTKKGLDEYDSGNIFYGTYTHDCMEILIDINGPSEPNTYDKDAFNFKVVQDGLMPAGSVLENIWTETFSNQCLGENIVASNRTGKCSA